MLGKQCIIAYIALILNVIKTNVQLSEKQKHTYRVQKLCKGLTGVKMRNTISSPEHRNVSALSSFTVPFSHAL